MRPITFTLVSFTGTNGQGAGPFAGVITDNAGNLLGTTIAGGVGGTGGPLDGNGTAFEILKTSSGYASTPTTLVAFDGTNQSKSYSGLIADASGNLFGTTYGGGTNGGQGTVFEIAKSGSGYASTPSILVTFNGANGAAPTDVIADSAGNLFGTTTYGGANGQGTVFEIVKTSGGYASTPITLATFNGANGSNPQGGLIADANGNLFGTTRIGGANNDGTVFEIVKTGSGYSSTPTTLVNFNLADGGFPFAGLIADGAGNLFGTTTGGGTNNNGTVFEIVKTGSGYASTPTTLVSFNGNNGSEPFGQPSALLADAAGNLFGTTLQGGAYDLGTVFEIPKTAAGYLNRPIVLVSFNGANGSQPYSSLIADSAGNLIGTTFFGGANGDGTVFQLSGTGFRASMGVTLTANDTPGQTLAGGPGNDTLYAGRSSAVLTGNGGADTFVYQYVPTNPGHVTDFTLGSDQLDLSLLLQASGYTGSDPVQDGYVFFESDGNGGTKVLLDTDGPASANSTHYTITTLDNVNANGLTWTQVSGLNSGVILIGNDTPRNLTGTSGDDTIIAGHSSDTITTGAGQDIVGFRYLPWNASTVTDFSLGTDQADFSQLLIAANYKGSDPVSDGYISFVSDGSGGTNVLFNKDSSGANLAIPVTVTDLKGVSPTGLTYAQLTNPSPNGGGGGGGGTYTSTGDFVIPNSGGGGEAAPLPNGGYVVVWTSTPQSGAVYGQRLDANGAAVGPEFLVSNQTQTSLAEPNVAALTDGGFAVAWEGPESVPNIHVQRFDANAAAVGGPTVLPPIREGQPGIAALGDGGYMVMWTEGDNVEAQLFDKTGAAVGAGTVVNSDSATRYEFDSVVPTRNGGVIVVYDNGQYSPPPGAPKGIFIQAFDSHGVKLGSAIHVSNATPVSGSPSEPVEIANLTDGSYVLTWTFNTDVFGGNLGVAMVRTDSSGQPIYGGDVKAPTSASDNFYQPQVSALPNGDYVIAWYENRGIVTQEFDTNGNKVGGEIVALGAMDGSSPDIVAQTNGSYLVLTGTSNVHANVFTPSNVSPPPSGQTFTANDTPGQTLTGGSGDDIFYAGHSSVVMTGDGGADKFIFQYLPWSAGHITDFTVGADRLDLSALFQASGYTGSDPVADGYLQFASDGSGGTRVLYDPDGPGTANPWPTLITTLDHVAPNGLTAASVLGGGSPPPPPPPPPGGQTFTANDTAGQTLTGGSGDDTFYAGHNSVVMTGDGGADKFIFQYQPWNAGHITDFTPGTDKLDLHALFTASVYTGTNPIADGYLQFQSDGQGGTKVLFDSDGPGTANPWPTLITTLDHVDPSSLHSGDWFM